LKPENAKPKGVKDSPENGKNSREMAKKIWMERNDAWEKWQINTGSECQIKSLGVRVLRIYNLAVVREEV
jgi:hypothetical protein